MGRGNRKRFHFDNTYWEQPKQFNVVSLYQIGDLSCHNGYEVGPHIQPCYEITYVVSGKGTIFTNDKPYAVSQGDVYISLPGDNHNLIADDLDPFRYLYLAFVFHDGRQAGPYDSIERLFQRLGNPVVYDQIGIETPFQNALQELATLSEYSQYMIEGYILQVIILTYRNICLQIGQYNPSHYTGTGAALPNLVYAVVSYIDQHLLTMENLQEVADTLSYSYSHLSHIFREETGMTLQTYYHSRRMSSACEMLKSGCSPISGIAKRLRYQSVHAFSKAFKKAYGISPAQYRCLLSGKEQDP